MSDADAPTWLRAECPCGESSKRMQSETVVEDWAQDHADSYHRGYQFEDIDIVEEEP